LRGGEKKGDERRRKEKIKEKKDKLKKDGLKHSVLSLKNRKGWKVGKFNAVQC
jgi:hypothetical protein